MNRVRVAGDGPKCWCGKDATFSGMCPDHYDTDTGRHIGPPRTEERSLGGLPSYYARLDVVARRLDRNARNIFEDGSFLVHNLDMAALRAALGSKPDAYEAADIEEGRKLLFSAVREAVPGIRGETMIEAILAFVGAEVERAVECSREERRSPIEKGHFGSHSE